MSKQIHESGPAFPLKEPLSNDSLGISVRDYFAAKALQGFIASGKAYDCSIASESYYYADCMLQERSK